jgi:outer membrane protein assembly factor BamB
VEIDKVSHPHEAGWKDRPSTSTISQSNDTISEEALMSAGATTGHNDSTSSPPGKTPRSARILRLWPAILLLVVFWVFLYANHNIETWMLPRFLSRLLAYGILILGFLAWWLTRSAVSWRDRFLTIGAVVGFGAAACVVADRSMNPFALFMSAIPYVLTVATAWLLISSAMKSRTKRIGFCVLMLLTFGYFDLIRLDGLDASQREETSWRWIPTNEQTFLSGRGGNARPANTTIPTADKPWTPRPGDCLEYRGANRDGVVAGTTLTTNWNDSPPKLLWREKVGPAWSGMIVVDGRIVTQEQRGDLEAVVCYDAATGKEVWAHTDPGRFEESLSGAGPRGTPTFADGRIYASGAKGLLNCLAAETGAVIWSRNVVADASVAPADMPQWGFSESPLVVDGFVVVFAGGAEGKSVLAYQIGDGKLAWTAPGGKQSYSSPQLATLDGQKQIVMHDSHSLMGINIADGNVLWELSGDGESTLPMLQPHVTGADRLVISVGGGASAVAVKRIEGNWFAAPVWTTNKFRPDFNDFVIHKDAIYALSDGVLCCLDVATGKQLWKKGRLGHGQILMLADQDALLMASEKGEVILVSVSRDGFQELGRFQAIEGKTWNGPVLANGRFFLRNGEEMAAFELPLQNAVTDDSAATAR